MRKYVKTQCAIHTPKMKCETMDTLKVEVV